MSSSRRVLAWTTCAVTMLGFALPAQSPARDDGTGGACVPVSTRAGRTYGCWILRDEPQGKLESVAFWHLEAFPTVDAATAAKGPHGTVLRSLGKVWLATIADSAWRSAKGKHVATIGPLPIAAGAPYSAMYMEAVFRPG